MDNTTVKSIDDLDVGAMFDEYKVYDDMRDDIDNRYMSILGGAIRFMDNLEKIKPMFNDKILSPEVAIMLDFTINQNNIMLNVLEYGEFKNVPLSIQKIMKTTYKTMNALIKHIAYLDALNGGNLTNMDYIKSDVYGITPKQFKYTDNMIDLDNPIFDGSEHLKNEVIDSFKEEYKELF